jgi:hypothetical protein
MAWRLASRLKVVTSRHSRTAMLEPDLRTYSQITLDSSTFAGNGVGAGGNLGDGGRAAKAFCHRRWNRLFQVEGPSGDL